MGEFTKQHLFVDRLKSGKLEYFEDLYNYYYYIAEKHYNKYEDEKKIKAKNLAEEILTNAPLILGTIRSTLATYISP